MSDLIPVLRAIIRDELASRRGLQLGVVRAVHSNEDGSGDQGASVDVQLRGSELVLQQVPVLAARSGLAALPAENDLVVLDFIDGQLTGAVVLGVLHSEEQRPPEGTPEEVIYQPPEPPGDARRLALLLPGGGRLEVRDEALEVELGGTRLLLQKDGAIEIEASGDLSLKAGGAVSIEATGALSLAGSEITSQAQASQELSGPTIKIAGLTSFSAS